LSSTILITKLSEQAQGVVQSVLGGLRGVLKVSKEQQIQFVDTVLERETQGQFDLIDFELWRVGLIADARLPEMFLEVLDSNKRSVRALAHPISLQSSPATRAQSLLVDDETERKLLAFFRGRSLQDVNGWSQALAAASLTFDRWRFPEQDQSDIKNVTVQRFLNGTKMWLNAIPI
jgi:DNA phosphorothioation-dependent restriction protein DptH